MAKRPGTQTQRAQDEALLNSPEATALKQEMIRTGRKLWDRQYVDGNGGNISYRLSPERVICTPTLLSKADLTPADFCLVDLEGNQVAGKANRTSEILLHVHIYRTVPQARAAVHAHPPYATAYALAGCVPPSCITPEQGFFLGPVALVPYETPGTREFAESVVPYAKDHNTILLANHGVVCWADTVTHAEWNVEIIDTYCRQLMLAAQLGAGITLIPSDKQRVILENKRKRGLPDANFGREDSELLDQPGSPGVIALRRL